MGPPLSCNHGLWKDAPLEEIAEACGAAAFRGIEQRGAALPAVLASPEALADNELTLSALTLHEPWYDRAITATHRPALPELLDGLAASEPAFCILSVPGSNERMSTAGWPNAVRYDALSAGEHATLVDTVQSVADMIRSIDVQVAFRPRLASFIETEDEIEQFLELTEPELVTLALDLGHLALMEIDPMALIERHGARISYCYVRNLDERLASEIHLGMRNLPSAAAAGLFVPPGQGSAAIGKPLRRLLRGEACQWYTLDLQPDTVAPRKALDITFDYMQEVEAGQD